MSIRVTDKPASNVELLVNLCEFSRFGALAQVFLMEAIRKYADAVATADPSELGPATPLFNPVAWQGVAADIRKRVDEFYGRDRVADAEPDDEEEDCPPQPDPTIAQRNEFRQYLHGCTDRQVQGVYEKERDAGRAVYKELAIAEAERRGITLEL